MDKDVLMSEYNHLKDCVYQCNMELLKQGLVVCTFGNASAVDRETGVMAIKPSGIDYQVLKPEDIVILDLDGNQIEGHLTPSSDTKTHLILYKSFSSIGGIVHTHATYSVAWAQAQKPIPVLGTTHADHLNKDIPCSENLSEKMIKDDYEMATGKQIIRTFEHLSYQEIEMVLVAGHGPFTWGATPEKAVYNSVILEELAKMAYITKQINPQVKRLKKMLINKHFQRKHGPDAYYGQK
jgi:L-ribulose-5-phosphate 4-epimerase